MVGTTVKKVTLSFSLLSGRNGAANLSHTAVALNGKRNSIADPENRGVMIALTVPWI